MAIITAFSILFLIAFLEKEIEKNTLVLLPKANETNIGFKDPTALKEKTLQKDLLDSVKN